MTDEDLAAFDAAYDHAACLGQNAELELCEELPRLRATIAAIDKDLKVAIDAQSRAEARAEKLETALRLYANPATYDRENGVLVMDDMGNLGDGTFALGATARAALAETRR